MSVANRGNEVDTLFRKLAPAKPAKSDGAAALVLKDAERALERWSLLSALSASPRFRADPEPRRERTAAASDRLEERPVEAERVPQRPPSTPFLVSVVAPEPELESEADSLAQLFARLEKVARKAEATEPKGATIVPLRPTPRRIFGAPLASRSSERS
jgi:hypothetical protein